MTGITMETAIESCSGGCARVLLANSSDSVQKRSEVGRAEAVEIVSSQQSSECLEPDLPGPPFERTRSTGKYLLHGTILAPDRWQ